jgi:hypothetical protein
MGREEQIGALAGNAMLELQMTVQMTVQMTMRAQPLNLAEQP